MYELKIYRGVLRRDNAQWYKIWRGIYSPFQNCHEEFDEFWPKHLKVSKICTLMVLFWTKYIMFELKKHMEVMFDGTEYWCKIWRKTGLCFQNDMRNLANFHRLKDSNFILESKMAELNQNKNSKQSDWPDTV